MEVRNQAYNWVSSLLESVLREVSEFTEKKFRKIKSQKVRIFKNLNLFEL